MYKTFSGAGGFGGGGGGGASVAPDTAKSRDTIEFVLGLGQGEFEGPVNELKSFYIGNTPLQNADGSFNFTAFSVFFFQGSPSGENIDLRLGGSASSTSVGVAPTPGGSITRTTTHHGISHINIRILFTNCYDQDSKGNIKGVDINFKIEYKKHSAGSTAEWTNPYGQNIVLSNVKFTQSYVKEMQFDVPPLTNDFYDIRITKLDPNDSTTIFRDWTWESFQEILPGPLNFPNTATVHAVGEASNQLTSIPQFSTDMYCRKIKVPSTYTYGTKWWTATWDGTWKIAYSNNPALVLYDFITDDEQGLATYADINIDIYDVFAAAVWCDYPVPIDPANPSGPTRPRYTCNLTLQEPQSGIDMLRYLAGIFNGIVFDQLDGSVRLIFDDSTAPANHLIGKQDIVGKFTYSFTDIVSRYNDLTVTFTNPDLDWQEDRRRVHDQTAINKYGRVPLDFVAVGCIDPDEAVARAKYKLLSTTTEVQQLTFTRHRMAEVMQPWDIALIADEDMGYGVSGRILSQSGNTVTLRDPIFLEHGISYQFQANITNPNYTESTVAETGKSHNEITVIVANVTNAPSTSGPTYTLTMDSIPTLPEFASFSLSQTGAGIGLPKPFRILSIEDDSENKDLYRITALEVNRNKQAVADGVASGNVPVYSFKAPDLVPITNLSVTEVGYYINNVSYSKLAVVWDFSPNILVKTYKVSYVDPQGASMALPVTDQNSIDIKPALHGVYSISVQGVCPDGRMTGLTTVTFTATGEGSVPATPLNFVATGAAGAINLSWSPNYEPDIQYYTIYGATGTGLAFHECAPIAQIMGTAWTHNHLGYGQPWTYYLKATNPIGTSPESGHAFATTLYIFADAIKMSEDPLAVDLATAIADLPSLTEATSGITNLQTTSSEQSDVISNIAAVLNNALGAVDAIIQQHSNTIVDQHSATATMVNNLQAQITGKLSQIQESYTNLVNDQSTLAQRVTDVRTTVDSNVATIAETLKTTDGINASWTIQAQLDTNGEHYVSGIGLQADIVNGKAASEMVILVDKFILAAAIDNSDGTKTLTATSPAFEFVNGQIHLTAPVTIDNLVSGNGTFGNLIIQPASASDNFIVRRLDGTTFIDTNLGIVPGTVTFPTIVTDSSTEWHTTSTPLTATINLKQDASVLINVSFAQSFPNGTTPWDTWINIDGQDATHRGGHAFADAVTVNWGIQHMPAGEHTFICRYQPGGNGLFSSEWYMGIFVYYA